MSANTTKTNVLHSQTYNPWFNLATEDWIFQDLEPEGHILYLWSNSKTVVIGRCQNPWVECRLEQMEADGVKLARRQSGGGAVYHDKKNLNFTFMSGIEDYSVERNFEIIINALAQFGIKAEISGRNDLLVEGKKISGSAFKLAKDRAFHHGTLLIDVDMSRLGNYLNPDQRKLEAKGIKSVKSRVANLKDFNPQVNTENLKAAITREFFAQRGEGEERELDLDSLEETPELVKYYELMKSPEWLHQKTPHFNHKVDRRFDWGGIEILLDVRKGEVTGAAVFSDCLYPEMVLELSEKLKGIPYAVEPLKAAALELTGRISAWDDCLEDIARALALEFA